MVWGPPIPRSLGSDVMDVDDRYLAIPSFHPADAILDARTVEQVVIDIPAETNTCIGKDTGRSGLEPIDACRVQALAEFGLTDDLDAVLSLQPGQTP